MQPKQHTEWQKHLQTLTKQNYLFTMRWTIVVKIIVPVFPCFVSYSPAILKAISTWKFFILTFLFFFFLIFLSKTISIVYERFTIQQ